MEEEWGEDKEQNDKEEVEEPEMCDDKSRGEGTKETTEKQ